ncbi:GbsR/MarR family transcriptional regulator [Pseudooceanicola onchidii]|uniref:GbsR/MarR family transcriptional regulator n=1 Tax=Pseudooceanicola onchidii TaxID=2562279 RepID=UPI0010A9978A|nr:MarR family transcriptional regulator [Pseudooceanicola onchidii]
MTDTPEDRFVETLGLIFQGEGMPPISGRILGQLALADRALSLTEIAETLQVSKASVSTNVRLLEAKGIAVREARPGSRQDHWRAEARMHRGVLESLSLRFRRNAERIDEIADSFDPGQARQRRKVEEFSDFYHKSSEFLSQWAQTLDAAPKDQTRGAEAPDKTVSD